MSELQQPDVQNTIDTAAIFAKAGDGGNGASSFRREKFVPRGGPDGGDGGRGGSVYLVANPSVSTLLEFSNRRHFKAGRGGNGAGAKKHGKAGENVRILVPLGTVVSQDGELLADLSQPGDEVMVARGGRGGLGNVHFVTPTNQAPTVAQKGEPGTEAWVTLELKSIADVGLVGYPNVGKSSLLAALTAARPKIGDYPFTTLEPNLGVAERDHFTFVLADIPGLIEGAHKGVGLGHQFLRHVERARVLLHVIDASVSDPVATYEAVREELELYNPALAAKPEVVALNKIDRDDVRTRVPELLAQFREQLPDTRVVAVSAVTTRGVDELVGVLVETLAALPKEPPRPVETMKVYRLSPADEGWVLETEDDGAYRVRGKRVERVVAMTDLTNPDAVEMLQGTLKRMGILQALEAEGVGSGDTVRFGNVELEWE
ncbi:MAG: GTPase ObgE [Chloroflexi bacterium]|nr:GTPase ObgE [Chloroflexota bacterium]